MLKEIVERRSCRFFDPSKKVKEEDIQKIIDAGLRAPSGMNRQESVIVVFSTYEMRNKLAALNMKWVTWDSKDPFYDAPVIFLVMNKKSPFAEVDGACVIENMLLEATHLGLGSIWIHRAKEEVESEEGKALLAATGLNLDEYQGIGHAAVGYKLEGVYPPEKKIKEGRVFYIK